MLWKQFRILFLAMVLGGVLFVLLQVILAIVADNNKVKDSALLRDSVDLTSLPELLTKSGEGAEVIQ